MCFYSITILTEKERFVPKFERLAYRTGRLSDSYKTKDGYIYDFEFINEAELEEFKNIIELELPFLF